MNVSTDFDRVADNLLDDGSLALRDNQRLDLSAALQHSHDNGIRNSPVMPPAAKSVASQANLLSFALFRADFSPRGARLSSFSAPCFGLQDELPDCLSASAAEVTFSAQARKPLS
jgi:hypothetical protein